MLIVTYHAIEAPASPVCCPPELFAAHLAGLADNGFRFVTLDDCAAWLRGGDTAAPRSVVVTFDDAYRSIVTTALPLLQRYRVPAIVYAIGDRIGGDNQWPGQWPSIPRMPLADRQELAAWTAAGMSVGSHSWSHPRMTEIDDKRLSDELDASADRLEQIVDGPVRHFAYPYGNRSRREIEAARRRYITAVNAEPHLVHTGDDPHDLCRIDGHDLGLALRMGWLDPRTMGPYLALRRRLRAVRRRIDRSLHRA